MKICFVALDVFAYLSKETIEKSAGGAELQQVQIGKGLQQSSIDISYIVLESPPGRLPVY